MTSRTVSLLSWNLAMFERSAEAPHTWGHADIESAVRRRVLDLAPDVVAFQELPGLVPFVETHDMVRANPETHSGNLATLVARPLTADGLPMPSTIARTALLATFEPLDLTVANVHLPPGRGEADRRLELLRAIVAGRQTGRLVIIGDTNSRVAEEGAIEALGLDITRPPSPTWDGRRNRFLADGPRVQAYFTRAFTAGPVSISEQSVLDSPETSDGHTFHLSDHFPLLVAVELT